MLGVTGLFDTDSLTLGSRTGFKDIFSGIQAYLHPLGVHVLIRLLSYVGFCLFLVLYTHIQGV